MPDFLPRPEGELLRWSASFDQRINSSGGEYGIPPEAAAEYHALHEAFAAAYQLAQQPSTRTPSSLIAKDEAKAAVVRLARALAGVARAAPEVTDAQRVALGIRARPGPAPRIGPPALAPLLLAEPVVRRNAVRVRLLDAASPSRTAKPRGVAGATLFTFVGEDPPADPSQWAFRGNVSRTTAELVFPPDVPPGARVWVSAHWFNPAGRPGPAATPVSTRVCGGWAMAA